MNFQRAVVIAVMADIMSSSSELAVSLLAVGVGAALWHFTPDPLPDAVAKGIEDFARKHRRGGR